MHAIKLNPKFCFAHRSLSQILKYKINDKHLTEMKKIYTDSKINDSQKKELAFALGKASEDTKEYSTAFKYFDEGNKIQAKIINFSISDNLDEFKSIKETFNENIFKKFKKVGELDDSAIFILGMPRSGTTLLEQILSSHPHVYGGDELNYLTKLVIKNFGKIFSHSSFDKLINNNIKSFKKMGKAYIMDLKKISNNSSKITDKLPINFKWIGLIKLILPNSKIIHCSRDPRDNCFSIYKNYFTSKELNFAYDLNNIVQFYLLYNDLMKYWHKNIANFIYDIKYEDLIESPDKEIKKLLKFCKLPWNDNCLHFYNNRRPIKTASDIQVRSKIYKSSINSWKNYEKYLLKYFKKLPN